MYRLLIAALVWALFLLGCSETNDSETPFSDNFDQSTAQAGSTFEGFKIDSELGVQPFAVLVEEKDGKNYFCTVSQIESGLLAGNAHCVQNRLKHGIKPYQVIYPTENGTKSIPIKGFKYVGDPLKNDIALIEIEPPTDWKAIDAQPIAWPANQKVVDVTVWALEPTAARSAKLNPVHCKASRQRPELFGKYSDSEQIFLININSVDPKMHVILESCTETLTKGTSGSLISLKDNPSEYLGVYHWNVRLPKRITSKYATIGYTTNEGETRSYPTNELPDGFYGVGTLMNR